MKFTKDETNMSHLVQSKVSGNMSGYVNYSNNFRPISATNKRPGTAIGSGLRVNSAKKHPQDFPMLNKGSGISSYGLSHNHSHVSSTLEKEKLYEEALQLKTQINQLKRELASAKSDIHKKDLEINKKDKVIEDIAADSGIYSGNGDNIIGKAKDTTLIIKMKKQYKELKKDYGLKCDEVEELKKLAKITKFNELTIEINTLTEELNKIKTLYTHSLQQNEMSENKSKDLHDLQENFSKQHFIIISLQEALAKANEEIRSKDEEINKLKSSVYDKSEAMKKMKRDLQISNQVNEKLSKERREPEGESSALKNRYETMISDLQREASRYRDMTDRSNRQVRELESQIKRMGMSGNNNNNFKTFNYNDIKHIQENPEEKYDNITLLLKSKLQEQVTEKEQMRKVNRNLKKKIKFYEQQLGYKVNDEDVQNLDGTSSDEEVNNRERERKIDNNRNSGNHFGREKQQKDILKQENNNANNDNSQNQSINMEKENKKSNISNLSNINDNHNRSGEQENDPLKSGMFTEDQLTEFTYIMIKNFEAKHLNYEEANDKIIREAFFVNRESSSLNTDTNAIINKLCFSINTHLNIKKEEDKNKIRMFLTAILALSNSDIEVFMEKVISLFYNVKIYKQEKENKIKKKLRKYLKSHADYLKNILVSNDANKTGLVTFISLRKILESISLRLKDKYIEYLIYAMKSANTTSPSASIYDLNYDIMFKIIEEAPDDSKDSFSSDDEDFNNESNEEKDESEIVITSDQFHEKVNNFLKSLMDHMKENKTSIRQIFSSRIYRPCEVEKDPMFKEYSDEAVELKIFLEEMNKINISLSNLDVYCLYTKFKIVDDYEAISITGIERELDLVGIKPGESENKSKF